MSHEPRIVVDTSALVDAGDARNPDWREAFTYLHGAYEIEAPPLLVSEAGNVVHRKLLESFGETTEERSRILETLLDGVRVVPRREGSIEQTGKLAERHELTVYDAEFLELATRAEEADLAQERSEAVQSWEGGAGGRPLPDLEDGGGTDRRRAGVRRCGTSGPSSTASSSR